MPIRNLSILVICYKEEMGIIATINELKKFSAIADADYFSYERHPLELCSKFLLKIEDYKILEVKPRLFRKIINN